MATSSVSNCDGSTTGCDLADGRSVSLWCCRLMAVAVVAVSQWSCCWCLMPLVLVLMLVVLNACLEPPSFVSLVQVLHCGVMRP